MKKTIPVLPEARGLRIDKWLSDNVPELSRSRIQSLLRSGDITADGKTVKPHHKLAGGESIEISIPEPRSVELVPEDIPLDILHEDESIVVVNKAAGMVVHPAPGHYRGTLVNALLHHCTGLGGINGELRPGIVHRLDKDTSGAIIVAKTDRALRALQAQFKSRAAGKEYIAVAWGQPRPPAGTIETTIGRSSHDRKKMSVNSSAGRDAVTRYETIEAFEEMSLMRLVIETGRTHQIRVHLAHLRHPVVGDRDYGGRRRATPLCVNRQMLHAHRLEIAHPETGKKLEFVAPLPDDMQELLAELREEEAKE